MNKNTKSAFIKIIPLTMIAILAVLVYTDHQAEPRRNVQPVKIASRAADTRTTIEKAEEIGKKRAEVALKAAGIWRKVYGECGHVTIKPYTDHEVKYFGDGSMEVTSEEALPGLIQLGPDAKVGEIILHAMTHACVGEEKLLKPAIAITDGQVIGFRGLTMKVRFPDGSIGHFNKWEEGAAERNASCIMKEFEGYTVANANYFRMGKLTRGTFPCGDDRVVQMLRESDGLGFVAAVLRIPREAVDSWSVERVMELYDPR